MEKEEEDHSISAANATKKARIDGTFQPSYCDKLFSNMDVFLFVVVEYTYGCGGGLFWCCQGKPKYKSHPVDWH